MGDSSPWEISGEKSIQTGHCAIHLGQGKFLSAKVDWGHFELFASDNCTAAIHTDTTGVKPVRPRRRNQIVGAIMSSVLLAALQAAPASALPEKFFGMTAQEHAYDVSPEYGEPNWAAMQNAGVQKFRMEIKWNKVVEAGGGNWRTEAAWQGSYDHYIENAAKHGIAILPYIYGRSEGSTQYYQLKDVAFHEFKEFVWTVVQRYGQAGSFWVKLAKNNPSVAQYPVTTWEVWNEPNLPNNCPAKTCNGKEYGEFLVAISNTIHEAQRAIWPSDGSQVLFGGIYLERFDETLHDCAKHWCISNYLASAAQVPGIKTAYDGLSLHSYAFGKPGEHRQYSEKIAAMPSNVNEAYNAQANAMGVNGHREFPRGGHPTSPLAATTSPHRWPSVLPTLELSETDSAKRRP